LREKGERDLKDGKDGSVEELDASGGICSDESLLLSSGDMKAAAEGVCLEAKYLSLHDTIDPVDETSPSRSLLKAINPSRSLVEAPSPNHSSLARLVGPLNLPAPSKVPSLLELEVKLLLARERVKLEAKVDEFEEDKF
jgi:hypothetical protein